MTTASERFGRAAEGIDAHRHRLAEGLDGELALIGRSSARLGEAAAKVVEVHGALEGSLGGLRNLAEQVLGSLGGKASAIEGLLLQTESIESAVSSAVASVGTTNQSLREQAKGLGELRKSLGDFVRRLEKEVGKAEALGKASSRLEEVANQVAPLRAALEKTMVRVDEAAVSLLDSLHAKTKLFAATCTTGRRSPRGWRRRSCRSAKRSARSANAPARSAAHNRSSGGSRASSAARCGRPRASARGAPCSTRRAAA